MLLFKLLNNLYSIIYLKLKFIVWNKECKLPKTSGFYFEKIVMLVNLAVCPKHNNLE